MIGTTRKRTLWIAALLFLSVVKAAMADLLLVPEDHASIAAALGAASHGDTVSLAVGSYFEHDLVLPPGVSLLGRGAGPEDVLIDAQGAGRVIWGENLDESNALENLTLYGGYLPTGDGSGAYLDGPVLLRNLIVEENSNGGLGNGVGIYARHLSLVEDCVFRNNRTPSMNSFGGGLCINSSYAGGCTLRRVDFIGNEGGSGAAFIGEHVYAVDVRAFENTGSSAIEFRSGGGGPSFLIENSVVAHNEADGIVVRAIGTILGCTIVHCRSGVVSAGIPESGSTVQIDNSIVAFNSDDQYGGGVVSSGWLAFAYFSCSDVYGNLPLDFYLVPDPTGTDGNISEDPLFCPESGPQEYLLRDDSPCAPGNHPDSYDCGLIGAFPVGCGVTATEDTSWSRIKRLY